MDDRDSDLLRDASRGDANARTRLFERHLPGLQAFLRLRASPVIRDRESVADLAQSVCREAIEQLGRFDYRGEEAFRSFLFTIAIRKLVQRQRHYDRAKRDVAREVAPRADDAADRLFEAYRTMFTPSRDAAAREEIARFEAAFDALPEHYREVILLTRVAGLSQREAAERMGRTAIAIQGLLTRALVKLSALLQHGPGSG